MATRRRTRRNAGGSVDSSAARELELFIENDSQLYNSQEKPIQKNLITKMARGVYNHAGAVKLYGYLMESGAKKYNREHGGGGSVWHEMFNTATRKAAAERFANSFETEAKLGNYDQYLPKKYQKKSNPRHSSTSSTLLPAKVRINPRTGKVQVFVTPKVAAQVKGGRGRNPKSEYEVIVGNIGTVYSGGSISQAKSKFATYVKQSKSDSGRAGGEDVTIMKDGEPIKEFYGSRSGSDW